MDDVHPFGRPFVVVWHSQGKGRTMRTAVFGPFATPEAASDWMDAYREAIKKKPDLTSTIRGMEVAVFERWFVDAIEGLTQ